ncbi:pirin-like C-terminal cupin domain-containing protein [Prevotella dentasini]|uniref:pirin-like C-terminal cupin domain-containing protein n=1 Tax=Prevotella dentasini TaxID=589537 RepID=UPI00046999A5|nr:pirin-like C-terminal cupin domain-containing protein [Prevotella dentasini]
MHIDEKTAAKLGEGNTVSIEAGGEGAEIMLMSSRPLNEPIAWYGPVVMNTEGEIRTAISDMNDGTFIKQATKY